MKNISTIKDCFGCGVCAAACGKKIISIVLNADGFYEPRISNATQCSNCGICTDVCAFLHTDSANSSLPLKSWASWSNNSLVRKKCSSGGVCYEIGKQLLERGYKVVSCKYDVESQVAKHFIASTVDEFIESIGSKYIQSYTVDAFRNISFKGEKYLIVGTPCQIESFRRLIKRFRCEDNFILVDFFCHCIPSMLAWESYKKMLESKYGRITYASWRNKFHYGWHDSWTMGVDGEKSNPDTRFTLQERNTIVQSRMSKGDLFFRLFLGDIALGPQCEHQCRFKYNKSSADIRVGDLWGKAYKDNEEGVNALIAFTKKGIDTIESLENVTFIEHTFDEVADGQMKQNARHKEMQPIVMFLLKKQVGLTSPIFKFTFFIQKVISKLKSLTKKYSFA